MLCRFPRIDINCRHLTLKITIEQFWCAVKLFVTLPLNPTGGSTPDPSYKLALAKVAGAYTHLNSAACATTPLGVLVEFFLHRGLPLLFSHLCVKWLLQICVASKICIFICLYLDGILVYTYTSFGPSFRRTVALKLSASGGFSRPCDQGLCPGHRWGPKSPL